MMLAQRIHPRVVMEVLGRSQISLTMNTYAHVLPAAVAPQSPHRAVTVLLCRDYQV